MYLSFLTGGKTSPTLLREMAWLHDITESFSTYLLCLQYAHYSQWIVLRNVLQWLLLQALVTLDILSILKVLTRLLHCEGIQHIRRCFKIKWKKGTQSFQPHTSTMLIFSNEIMLIYSKSDDLTSPYALWNLGWWNLKITWKSQIIKLQMLL